MKKIILHVIIFTALASCNEGKKNLANAEKIFVGMNSKEVIDIMGPPLDTYSYENFIEYRYEAPFAYSDYISVRMEGDTVQWVDMGH